MDHSSFEKITVTSDAFKHEGVIPIKYTGRGQNISPGLQLSGISPNARSIAIAMDDLDIPLVGHYNHWVIWNIPAQETIPENIPHGAVVDSIGGAVQGIGYGKHGYRGPKPPLFIRSPHRYQFHVYVLDSKLELNSDAKKKDLLQSMAGHIIQYGSITGTFRN